MMDTPNDQLEARLRERLGAQTPITICRKVLAGTERIEMERRLVDGTRYLQITPLEPSREIEVVENPWEFLLLGGLYGCTDPSHDFDGRCGGDAAFVVDFAKRWLVALEGWDDLVSSVR